MSATGFAFCDDAADLQRYQQSRPRTSKRNLPGGRELDVAMEVANLIADWQEAQTIAEFRPIKSLVREKKFVVIELLGSAQVRPNSLQEQFRALSDRWYLETMWSSSITDAVIHPSYQRIIGMGPQVIPLVLLELRDKGGHWYWALRALTGADPVHEEHRGDVPRMREDWVGWGQTHGYL